MIPEIEDEIIKIQQAYCRIRNICDRETFHNTEEHAIEVCPVCNGKSKTCPHCNGDGYTNVDLFSEMSEHLRTELKLFLRTMDLHRTHEHKWDIPENDRLATQCIICKKVEE